MAVHIIPSHEPIPESSAPQRMSAFVRGARWVYVVCIGLLMAGIVAQVFLAGAGALVSPAYWTNHELVGHLMGQIVITILIVGLFGRLPWRIHGLNVLVVVLYALQYIFLWVLPEATGVPVLRALHAVNALAMFGLGSFLMGHGRMLARQRVV